MVILHTKLLKITLSKNLCTLKFRFLNVISEFISSLLIYASWCGLRRKMLSEDTFQVQSLVCSFPLSICLFSVNLMVQETCLIEYTENRGKKKAISASSSYSFSVFCPPNSSCSFVLFLECTLKLSSVSCYNHLFCKVIVTLNYLSVKL